LGIISQIMAFRCRKPRTGSAHCSLPDHALQTCWDSIIRLALSDSKEHAFCHPDHGVFRFADERRLSFARKDPSNLEVMDESNLYNKRHKQAKSIAIFSITNLLPKICCCYSQIGKLRRLVKNTQGRRRHTCASLDGSHPRVVSAGHIRRHEHWGVDDILISHVVNNTTMTQNFSECWLSCSRHWLPYVN
jgi:hypothetical protein